NLQEPSLSSPRSGLGIANKHGQARKHIQNNTESTRRAIERFSSSGGGSASFVMICADADILSHLASFRLHRAVRPVVPIDTFLDKNIDCYQKFQPTCLCCEPRWS